jgi:integrase
MRVHILPELGNYRLDEITKPMMKRLVAGLVEKGLAKDTIRLILAAIRVLYSQAIDDKVVTENPASGLGKFYRQAKKRHGEINPLTEEESLLFLEKTLEYERKHYPLFLCALHSGMRSGELVGVQWTDIDWNGKFLEVRRAINRFGELSTVKTENGRRRIDLSDHLLETLRDLRKQKQEEALKEGKNEIPEWIFSNQFGSFADIKNIKFRNLKRVLRKAGIRDIRFHDLRHTFASQLLSNGTNILYVSQQLGHSNPGITMKIYAKWIPNEGQRQAMNELPYVGRLPAVADSSKTETVAV